MALRFVTKQEHNAAEKQIELQSKTIARLRDRLQELSRELAASEQSAAKAVPAAELQLTMDILLCLSRSLASVNVNYERWRAVTLLELARLEQLVSGKEGGK